MTCQFVTTRKVVKDWTFFTRFRFAVILLLAVASASALQLSAFVHTTGATFETLQDRNRNESEKKDETLLQTRPRRISCNTIITLAATNQSCNDKVDNDKTRRRVFVSMLSIASVAGRPLQQPAPANAFGGKSRTDGYAVQKTDKEWKQELSQMQYFILRDGGTERPGSSILESEKRSGIFVCAGCNTPLFDSMAKFKSGTGWPSFASYIENNVEVEQVNKVQKTLGGAEVRCANCGGHLGDVFQDGFLFVGTPAFVTGERYCIDGAALKFIPSDKNAQPVSGDLPPPTVTSSGVPPTL